MADEWDSDDDYASGGEDVLPELTDEELLQRFKQGHLKGSVRMQNLVAQAAQRRIVPANRTDALTSKRHAIELLPTLPWPETFVLEQPALDPALDPNDDFKREDAFYMQAFRAAEEAEKLLKKHGIAKTRPADYFAETAKSDDHMERVRQKLLNDQASAEASERAKKQREIKKYGKQVQKEVLAKRQAEKKAAIESVKRRRKGVQQQLRATDDALDFDVDTFHTERDDQQPHQKSAKRAKKDAKFGFGGKKRMARKNTAESAASGKGFSQRANKKPFAGTPGARPGTRKPAKRPGKAARQKSKGRS